SFGDLIATARLQGTKISGSAHPTGDAGLYLDQFTYDTDDQTVAVRGRIRSIDVPVLSQALANSPFVASDPEGTLSASVVPALSSFMGQLEAPNVTVSGKIWDLVAS